MDWESRVAKLWDSFDELDESRFLAAMQELVGERPPDDPRALFELACAYDSAGHSDLAVPLYRRALDVGLTGILRRRATIQLASSMRNLRQSSESVELLQAELEKSSDELDDAVSAFLALALADIGREREALGLALTALSRHLPRYDRSLANYARLLSPPSDQRSDS